MEEDQKQHLSVVNASGFPFQLAVAANIREQNTLWRPILAEHPWRHPETGNSGYIDLILQNRAATDQCLIVECKRQRGDSKWYFLDPHPQTLNVRHVFSTFFPTIQVKDTRFVPASHEASFCVLRGEDSSKRSMLERLADDLLQSVEAFAIEQRATDHAPIFQYLPVVVTNARLFLCFVDPTVISLASGELPDDAKFEEVPFVRFRKTLWSSRVTETEAKQGIEQVHRDRERTILVVTADTGLHNFLSNAHFDER